MSTFSFDIARPVSRAGRAVLDQIDFLTSHLEAESPAGWASDRLEGPTAARPRRLRDRYWAGDVAGEPDDRAEVRGGRP